MLYVVLRGMAVSIRESRHSQLASRRRTADIFRRNQAQHRGDIRSHSRNRGARDEPLQEKATTVIHPTYILVQNLFPKKTRRVAPSV